MQQNFSFLFNFPTRLYFGPGCLKRLGDAPLPGKRALIVTTKGGSMKRTGILDRVLTTLTERGIHCTVFDRFGPNPQAPECDAAAEICRQEKLDFLVGLGGGSAIDAAKGIAIAAANPGHLWDYLPEGTGGKQPLKVKPLPVVAITTTAGTGTEADPWFVVSQGDEKMGWGTWDSFPAVSFVDPELMLTVPPMLTAWQGLDTLFHCMEAFVNRKATAMCDLFALEGIRLVGANLATCVKDGKNLEARTQMALANTYGGFTEWVGGAGCISEHSLEHAMGSLHPHLTHGKGLTMICVEYYRRLMDKGADPARFAAMAQALKGTPSASAEEFLPALQALLDSCGVGHISWAEEGITKEELPRIAALSRQVGGGMFGGDPVRFTDDDLIAILTRSWRA